MVTAFVFVIVPLYSYDSVHRSLGVKVCDHRASLGVVAVVLDSCCYCYVVHLFIM